MEKEYSAATANSIEGVFSSFNERLISQKTLFEDAFYLLLNTFDSFCIEQQKRIDTGLTSTISTYKAIMQIQVFCRYTEYTADTNVLFEDWCSFIVICENWLQRFEDYYPEYKGKMIEKPYIEPLPPEIHPKVYIKVYDTFNVEQQKEQDNKRVLPDELSTAQALIYWQRAKDKGFIDANYKFNGTNYQLTYFAKVMAEKLNLINKWKPFRDLWKYKYFSQTDREIKERFGFVKRQDEIDSIFE